MPVHYCSLHGRLLSGNYRKWVVFPPERLEAVRALYGFFRIVDIETSAYQVSETPCDRCHEETMQKITEELKKRVSSKPFM
jgi:hypothetical protein